MTVIMQPGVVTTTTTQSEARPELGIGALIFAMMSTIFITSLLCWWSLPFTIAGIILGATVSVWIGNYKVKVDYT